MRTASIKGDRTGSDRYQKTHMAQIFQEGCEIAGLLDGLATRRAEADRRLVGDDVGQRCLPEPRTAVEQDMVERLAASGRRLNEDAEVVLEPRLPDVLPQGAWAQGST